MLDTIISISEPLVYIFGFASAVYALYQAKPAQSTTAWILALIFVPFVGVPLYWAFGRSRYFGYVETLREFNERTESLQHELQQKIGDDFACASTQSTDARLRSETKAFEYLADSVFTRGNDVQLLIDGDAVFESVFASIESAKKYVLVQFYTIRDDEVGKQLKERLLAARQRGVTVFLLYDYIGSLSLSESYIEELRSAGANVSPFSGQRSVFGRFRLNFRNHRKVVVADGEVGFTGGLNVGDEYLGRDSKIGNWRDTHMRIRGPAAMDLQMSFARDWYFATQSVIDETQWTPACNEPGADVIIASPGPHDLKRDCGLLFAHLIGIAKSRVWIATPYFVPDERVIAALQLAIMRGVDVRIIVPRATDNPLFKFVPFVFIGSVLSAGGRVYFYEDGFLHQKTMLVDDQYGVVSTANFDNRSFFLNFEISCVVRDKPFCAAVEKMLEGDLSESTEISIDTLENRKVWQKLATQATRLLAPLL